MALIRKWDIDDKELAAQCIAEIITRIEELDGERPGDIAASDIIDIVNSHYGPEIYNKAIREVKKSLDSRFEDILTDVDIMQVESK